MNVRWPWLFRVMNRPLVKPLVPNAFYYWLLDRLSDNGGWRPLSIRENR